MVTCTVLEKEREEVGLSCSVPLEETVLTGARFESKELDRVDFFCLITLEVGEF